MRALAIALAFCAAPAAAQDFKGPVIPILISPAEDGAQVSVVVDPGLTSSRPLSPALRAAREAMHANEPVDVAELRALAEAGDGLAAQRYVRILLSNRSSASASDIAYFAAVAVGTGRIWTLEPMIEAMHRLDPGTEPRERIRKYIQVLYPHAWAGNTVALDALVAFNGEGRLFGPLSDATRQRILDQARDLDDGRTELSLAMGLLEAHRAGVRTDPQALEKARGYLQVAAASDHLAVRTTAENLLALMDNG